MLFLRIITVDIFYDPIVAIISAFFNEFFGEPTVFCECFDYLVSATRAKGSVVDIEQKFFGELFATLKKVTNFKINSVPIRFALIVYLERIKCAQ